MASINRIRKGKTRKTTKCLIDRHGSFRAGIRLDNGVDFTVKPGIDSKGTDSYTMTLNRAEISALLSYLRSSGVSRCLKANTSRIRNAEVSES
jgi:hypothetical protein